MSSSVRLALGYSGFELPVPAGIRVETSQALGALPEGSVPLETALEFTLPKLSEGKRRAAVLIGDLSLPAAYPQILPVLLKHMTALGVRPSRITVLYVPGGLNEQQPTGPILGRTAIRRFGESIIGEYEVRMWGGEQLSANNRQAEAEDPAYSQADLKIAVLPMLPEAQFALPENKPDLTCWIHGGTGERPAIFNAATEYQPKSVAVKKLKSDALLITGGGFPVDATLEEALISLRSAPAAKATVLAFQGDDGLGSAQFSLDLWSLLEQASELLSEGGELPKSSREYDPEEPWDPAGALALALARGPLHFFSPGLAEHHEGAELREFLEENPALSERFNWSSTPDDMWKWLREKAGDSCSVQIDPLGWRGREGGA